MILCVFYRWCYSMLFVADRNPSLAQNIQPCVLFERGHTFLGRAWPLKAEDSATEVRSKAQDRLSCSNFIQVQKKTCPQYGSIRCFFRLGGPGNHPELRFLRGNPWSEGPPLKETTTKRCALWCKWRKLKGWKAFGAESHEFELLRQHLRRIWLQGCPDRSWQANLACRL